MGLRGPQPEPTTLRLDRGNPGKRVINRYEPVPPAGEAKPPQTLSKAGRVWWDKLAPGAIAMGVLTKADVEAFAAMCEDRVLAARCRKILAKQGLTYTLTTKNGDEMPSTRPEATILNQCSGRIRAYEDRFGMTPAARTRIKAEPPTKVADPLEEFARKSG